MRKLLTTLTTAALLLALTALPLPRSCPASCNCGCTAGGPCCCATQP